MHILLRMCKKAVFVCNNHPVINAMTKLSLTS